MAEHVQVYGEFGNSDKPASVSRDQHKQIDRGLFQQAWSLLEKKECGTVDEALAKVGLHEKMRTKFLEECWRCVNVGCSMHHCNCVAVGQRILSLRRSCVPVICEEVH